MNSRLERALIRALHLVLSVPIVGYIYGPVASIPGAAAFTRYVAMPAVFLSGIWLWQKPRILRLIWKAGGRDKVALLAGQEGLSRKKSS